MPRFDKTGPEGKGSKTGRGLGDCSEKKNTDANLNWPNWFSRRRPGRTRGYWHRPKEQTRRTSEE